MIINFRKVVELSDTEKRDIQRVISILEELEDELEGEEDFSQLIRELEEIKYHEFVIEKEENDDD